jgi:predicted hydrocarbon binding protein
MFEIRKIQEQVLLGAVTAASDDATAAAVVYGEGGLAAEDNAAWVKSAMQRLEERFDKAEVKQIRMRCQCGYGMDEKLALVQSLMASAASMEEFANQPEALAGGLSCRGGELYLQFNFCPCPMLADVDRLPSLTWCQCTAGYSKVLFERAFGCPVDVELLQSIKAGDDICLMKILPRGTVWK